MRHTGVFYSFRLTHQWHEDGPEWILDYRLEAGQDSWITGLHVWAAYQAAIIQIHMINAPVWTILIVGRNQYGWAEGQIIFLLGAMLPLYPTKIHP